MEGRRGAGGWNRGGDAIALTHPPYSEAYSRGRDVAAGYRRGKTGSASDGQGLPVPLYQCKTDYFLGQRGHFTFYKLPFALSLSFSGLTLILKAEGSGRGGVTQDEKDTGRGREREKERKRGADEKHLRDAGNIWFHIRDRPERKLQIDKTLMFRFILLFDGRAMPAVREESLLVKYGSLASRWGMRDVSSPSPA